MTEKKEPEKKATKKRTVKRNSKGQFLPGYSAPSPGRKPLDKDVQKILLAACPDAANKLVELIHADKTRDQIRLRAIEVLFDRVYGKPKQVKDTEDTQAETIGKLVDILTKPENKKE